MLTRAQYLQVREQLRTLVAVAKNTPDLVETIDAAVKAGPAKYSQFWSEGPEQLVKDRALAVAVQAFAKGT